MDKEEFVNKLWGFSNTTTSTASNFDFMIDEDEEEDEEFGEGGVREPRKPILPKLTDGIALEKGLEDDLCVFANQ